MGAVPKLVTPQGPRSSVCRRDTPGDRGRLACPAEQQAADGNVALPEPQGCREMLAVLAAWGQQTKPGAGSGSCSRSRRVFDGGAPCSGPLWVPVPHGHPDGTGEQGDR